MTSAVEYSYIGNEFSLRVDESLINRAVRVKTIVKDKLKRIFEGNVSLKEAPQVENTTVETVPVQKETLIDLSEENLINLNEGMNALILQQNVPCVVSRAVLFTKPLVSKIGRVTGKWFKGMPVSERTVVSTETPSSEVSDGVAGTVPGTWDDMPEMTQDNLVPTVEPAVEEPINDGMTIPEPTVSEETAVYEPQVEFSAPNLESETPTASNGLEIPSFMPNMDELVPSNNDSVAENEVETPQVEFVPEPKPVDEVEERKLVSEPTTIVSEEPEVPAVEVAEPTVIPTTEVEQETSHEEVNSEHTVDEPNVEKKMTIEEKIAQLIERKNRNHTEEVPEVTAVSEQAPDEEADKKIETKPELTQAGVIARLQRLNNTMKDKDATIRSLTSKNEATREELAQARDKIGGYEAVVNDLTVKNNSLTKENERLNQKVVEAETASQSTIARLEAQVDELTEAKAEEVENFKRLIADLKEKHAKEIAELKEKHAAELKSVSETKERQIQAIYATISEALGETTPEEDYGRSMAA